MFRRVISRRPLDICMAISGGRFLGDAGCPFVLDSTSAWRPQVDLRSQRVLDSTGSFFAQSALSPQRLRPISAPLFSIQTQVPQSLIFFIPKLIAQPLSPFSLHHRSMNMIIHSFHRSFGMVRWRLPNILIEFRFSRTAEIIFFRRNLYLIVASFLCVL